MADAPHDTESLEAGPLTTVLNSAERETWARSRRVAFGVLAALSVAASAAAIYFWYLWVLTAQACIDAYIYETATPRLLSGEQNSGFQERFIALDISSFSAMILALLFTRLAYVGGRNTIRYYLRDRKSYFERAYHSVLFTEGFDSLCIRLGLLGTLLSFLLAAISQMGDTSNVTPAPRFSTLESQVAAIAEETGEAASASRSGDEPVEETLTTSRLSENMFLLLCASLVSTFVGTGVAYVVTPSLNWLNDRAVGRHQTLQVDMQAVAEEFFLQIDRTSRRLAEFETTTVKLTEAADHISSFEISVGTTADQLKKLLVGLKGGIEVFEAFNRNAKQLATKLDRLESLSDRLTNLMDRMPERLNDPLKNISLTAKNFRDAAMSGEAAFRELKSAAGTASASLGETHQRTQTSWQLIRELQDGLRELAKSEEVQTGEVSKLVLAFDRIGTSMEELIGQLDLLGQHLHQHETRDGERARLLAASRTLPRAVVGGSPPAGDVRAGSHHSQCELSGNSVRKRSWWQRLFG